MTNTPELTLPDTMECLVVGGVADGAYLRGVRADADVIQLSRPAYLKPLATPTQEQPEAAKETEDYQVRTFVLDGPNNTPYVIGLAMPIEQTLAETFSALLTAYMLHTVMKQQETDKSTTLRKLNA